MNAHVWRGKLILSLLLALGFVLSAAVAQTGPPKKECECDFDTKDYDAYGTHGACGIFMHKKRHSCEVSFSGTGANAKVLKDVLGEDASQSQLAIAPEILERYLAYERDGDTKGLSDARFIQRSLVVLERGALFRESSVQAKIPLKELDAMFVQLAQKNSERIAATFAGKEKAFDIEQPNDLFFSVGQGYVELRRKTTEGPVTILRVVYFSDRTAK